MAYRDGVALYYEDDGQGDPPILLVHGWCCDHTYFAPQFERYQREHRVVAVDLRGHGRSDTPEQDYTMAGFADDLAWLCAELGLTRPVVIGHSMGGVIALELAARHPDLPSAVVAVDSPLLPPQALSGAIAEVVAGLKSPAYRDVSQQFVGSRLFIEGDDPEVKARVVEAMSAAPQHVMASAMENIFSWDGEAAARRCAVPLLVLSAAAPLIDMARLKELCPQMLHGQTVGAGHFHQLLVPDQVNAMIDRFMAISLPRPLATA
jgi:pimeloyl-ACP methyl ester carboxylesterase